VCDTAVVSLSRKAQVTKSTLGLFKNKKIAKATAVLAKTASTATDTARSTHVNITEAACLRAPHMPAENKRKYISVNVKKAVWQRADHKCEYTDPRSKRRCGQKRFLHIDHIRPIAQGGSDSFANLQLLCSAHNLWKSDR
jgi:CRISPR/Cas system Type II protein with McrA/HNH and RuvC-like nuclease domain